MTIRLRSIALVCLVMVCALPAKAKNDIRGVTVGDVLQDAMESLDLDQAACGLVIPRKPIVCVYDDDTRMTLYFGQSAPYRIAKIVYDFRFKDLDATRMRLHTLYGLRKNRVEGEHRLSTGEHLFVSLTDGLGSLSIVDDRQIPQAQK